MKPQIPVKPGNLLTDVEIDWKKVFYKISKIKEIKLRWFQFKIIYRILVTNSILKEMKIIQSNKCSFCDIEKDSILHYLWDCVYSQSFWKDLLICLKDKCRNCDRLRLTKSVVLFGHDHIIKTDKGFDYILLQAKFSSTNAD